MLQYVTKVELNYEICNRFNNFALAFSKKQENLLQISEKKCLKVYIMLLINLNQYIY